MPTSDFIIIHGRADEQCHTPWAGRWPLVIRLCDILLVDKCGSGATVDLWREHGHYTHRQHVCETPTEIFARIREAEGFTTDAATKEEA